jgi:hypothetical protein
MTLRLLHRSPLRACGMMASSTLPTHGVSWALRLGLRPAMLPPKGLSLVFFGCDHFEDWYRYVLLKTLLFAADREN